MIVRGVFLFWGILCLWWFCSDLFVCASDEETISNVFVVVH